LDSVAAGGISSATGWRGQRHPADGMVVSGRRLATSQELCFDNLARVVINGLAAMECCTP